MRRLNLFEIEDQKWCPVAIRDGITDYLRWFEQFWKMYQPIIPRLRNVLKELKTDRIVDLCSGAGGPWLHLYREFDNRNGDSPVVYLTDLYPNSSASEVLTSIIPGKLVFCSDPVSATNVPKHLTGFRTMFSAFHHFPPDVARSILDDAVRNRQGIAIFEISQRHPLVIIPMCFSFFMVILSTPFVRPFRWKRLFWTYILPAIPLAFMFDTIVSCFRTYSPAELKVLTATLSDGDKYLWDIGVKSKNNSSAGVTYLIGYPIPPADTLEKTSGIAVENQF